MQGRHFIVTAIALFGLAFGVGCGGGGDSTGSSSSSGTESTASAESGGGGLTKAEFIDQANAVCARSAAILKVKGQHLFKKIYSVPEDIAAKRIANEVIAPGFEAELSDLRALNVPPNEGKQVSAIYAAIEELVENVRANPKAEEFYPYKKAEKLAAAYGLTACGHP